MPISEMGELRRAAGALVLLVAGCAAPASVGPNPGPSSVADTVMLSAGGAEVAVASPGPYCAMTGEVDTGDAAHSLRRGHCALADLATGRPARVMIAAALGPNPVPGFDTGTLARLEEALHMADAAPLLALGPLSDAAPVRVRQSRIVDDVLHVLVEDPAAPAAAGVAPLFWRAFMGLDDRLVILTVGAAEGEGVDPLTLRRVAECRGESPTDRALHDGAYARKTAV
ncbi:MAG: hypothetical protein AAFW69_08770, partial [Pseudomonadota bacterium]